MNRWIGKTTNPFSKPLNMLRTMWAFTAAGRERKLQVSASPLEFTNLVFRYLLDRPADEADLKKYVPRLESGLSQMELVRQIVKADEFTEILKAELWGQTPDTVSDAEFIDAVYFRLLKRQPDPAGRISMLNYLGKGRSRHRVISAILSETEFAAKMAAMLPSPNIGADVVENIPPSQFVELAFSHLVGQSPSVQARESYLETMENGLSQTALLRRLIRSPEFEDRFSRELNLGSGGPRGELDIIRAAYDVVLNRQPDAPGLNTYANRLCGGLPVTALIFELTRSDEFVTLMKDMAGEAGYGYTHWVELHDTIDEDDRLQIISRIHAMRQRPLISLVSVCNDLGDEPLQNTFRSVTGQIYTNWEWILFAKGSAPSHSRKDQNTLEQRDKRIRVVSGAGSPGVGSGLKEAIQPSSGEFIAVLEPGDSLPAHALYMVAEELNRHPDSQLVFSDEDKIDGQGQRYDPYFKPDWSPDLFYSSEYILRLMVIQRKLLDSVLIPATEPASLFDLALHLIENAGGGEIRHIPHVLYHRSAPRGHADDVLKSAEDIKSARTALNSHYERIGVKARAVPAPGVFACHRTIFPLPDPPPIVSIIVPTKDKVGLLRACVGGLLESTDYSEMEVVIVDNNSSDPRTREYLGAITQNERVRIFPYEHDFNFSAINNSAAEDCRGDILCFLNNDIVPINTDWLGEMAAHALRPEVGIVGAKLYYPDDSIQHAGIVLGINDGAAHAYRHMAREKLGDHSRTESIQEFSAVTGACMVVRREVFSEVGGFDEQLPLLFNDVDLCLRVRAKGYRILWTPYAELYHFESATQSKLNRITTYERTGNDRELLADRWGDHFKIDPFYNPNLTDTKENFSLADLPRAPKPWKESG